MSKKKLKNIILYTDLVISSIAAIVFLILESRGVIKGDSIFWIIWTIWVVIGALVIGYMELKYKDELYPKKNNNNPQQQDQSLDNDIKP